MARISNTKWNELVDSETVLIETLTHINSTAPISITRGQAKESLADIKYIAYDALHEATQGWSCRFAKEVREAVYEHQYKTARQMVSTKSGIAKERALILISLLELITEGYCR